MREAAIEAGRVQLIDLMRKADSWEDWKVCPVCASEVKAKNLVRHYDRVHGQRTEKPSKSGLDSLSIATSWMHRRYHYLFLKQAVSKKWIDHAHLGQCPAYFRSDGEAWNQADITPFAEATECIRGLTARDLTFVSVKVRCTSDPDVMYNRNNPLQDGNKEYKLHQIVVDLKGNIRLLDHPRPSKAERRRQHAVGLLQNFGGQRHKVLCRCEKIRQEYHRKLRGKHWDKDILPKPLIEAAAVRIILRSVRQRHAKRPLKLWNRRITQSIARARRVWLAKIMNLDRRKIRDTPEQGWDKSQGKESGNWETFPASRYFYTYNERGERVYVESIYPAESRWLDSRPANSIAIAICAQKVDGRDQRFLAFIEPGPTKDIREAGCLRATAEEIEHHYGEHFAKLRQVKTYLARRA